MAVELRWTGDLGVAGKPHLVDHLALPLDHG